MGEQKLYFEDVKEGDEAPVAATLLTRTDLVRYAGASGDFNPMHHDEVQAVAAGQPSVFGHGMFSMGFLGRPSATTSASATSPATRCASPSRRGPTRCSPPGSSSPPSAGGRPYLVDLDVRLGNPDGEEKVVGEATAAI